MSMYYVNKEQGGGGGGIPRVTESSTSITSSSVKGNTAEFQKYKQDELRNFCLHRARERWGALRFLALGLLLLGLLLLG
jgi:hypothetical protein